MPSSCSLVGPHSARTRGAGPSGRTVLLAGRLCGAEPPVVDLTR